MNSNISIAIIGSINLDIVAHVKNFPQPGETITNAVVDRFPGGKGANQALAAHRLGASVFMVGRVGNDPAADEALKTLREEDVDLTYCKSLEDSSILNILRFHPPMPASPNSKYPLIPS